jgi:hypothetical protein
MQTARVQKSLSRRRVLLLFLAIETACFAVEMAIETVLNRTDRKRRSSRCSDEAKSRFILRRACALGQASA